MKKNLLLLVLMLWSVSAVCQRTAPSKSPHPTRPTFKNVALVDTARLTDPAPARIILDLEQAALIDATLQERDELKLKERSYLRELYLLRRQVRLERAANQKADKMLAEKDVILASLEERLDIKIREVERLQSKLVRARVIQIVQGVAIAILTYLVVLK